MTETRRNSENQNPNRTDRNWERKVEFGKWKRYRPDVGGHNDDDGERTEPGVSDGEGNVARDLRAGEVPERN